MSLSFSAEGGASHVLLVGLVNALFEMNHQIETGLMKMQAIITTIVTKKIIITMMEDERKSTTSTNDARGRWSYSV